MVDAENKNLIEVEVAYAKPEAQVILTITVTEGTTLEQAVNLSKVLDYFQDINHSELKLGIFGVVCKPNQTLRHGDRVEIYRALSRDPKEARRNRANKPS
jgi:uncharacterized protein